MARVIAVLLALVGLGGCAPQVKEVMVEKTTVRYAVMDKTWLNDCPILPPAAANPGYTAASLQERIDMWSTFYVRYAQTNGQCNVTSANARKYNESKRNEVQTTVCKEGVCK